MNRLNRCQRFRPVSHPRCIAEINKPLVRQTILQSAINHQTTNAGIKYPDWQICDLQLLRFVN